MSRCELISEIHISYKYEGGKQHMQRLGSSEISCVSVQVCVQHAQANPGPPPGFVPGTLPCHVLACRLRLLWHHVGRTEGSDRSCGPQSRKLYSLALSRKPLPILSSEHLGHVHRTASTASRQWEVGREALVTDLFVFPEGFRVMWLYKGLTTASHFKRPMLSLSTHRTTFP